MKDFFENNIVITIVGIIAGILTATSMLPQLIKTIKEKKSEDVSAAMLIVLISGVVSWIFYGFLRNDLPIIVTNAFSLLLNLCMLFFRWRYKNR